MRREKKYLLVRMAKGIEKTSVASSHMASALVLFMLLIVNLDVLGRNLFSIPFLGSIELISLMLPAVVFLVMPKLLLSESLIASRAVASGLGKRFAAFDTFSTVSFLLVSVNLALLFTATNGSNFLQSFADREFLGVPGDFVLATWPSKLGLTFGSLLFACVVVRYSYVKVRELKNPLIGIFLVLFFWSATLIMVGLFNAHIFLGLAGVFLLLFLVFLGVPMSLSLLGSSLISIWLIKEDFGVAVDTLGMIASGSVSDYVFSAVPMFIFLGLITSDANMGRDSLRVVRWLTFKLSGGLGIAVVLANALFAAMTGISIASAAIFSKIAYPYMVEEGYSKRFSLGLIAGSSILGMLIPPSILLIIYGVIAEVSINKLFLAAVIPGLILVIFLIIKVQVLSYLKLIQHAVVKEDNKRPEKNAFKGFYAVLMILLAVLGGIYTGIFTPTEAGATGSAIAIIFSIFLKRTDIKHFACSLGATTETSANILFLLLGASMFGMMLTLSGIPQHVGLLVAAVDLTLTEFTLIYLVLLIFLGMLIDSTSILLIMVPFALPTVISLNGDLIWFGIVSLLGVEIGLLTPPLGLSVLTIKGSLDDPHISLKDIFIGSSSFALMIFVLAVTIVLYPNLCQLFY